MIYEIEKAKDIYSRQTDKHLIDFAQKHGRTLQPEIRPILLDELNRRKIGQKIVKALENETALIREKDIEQLISFVQTQACPQCGNLDSPIVCSVQRVIGSFLLQWIDEETTTLCCINCRKKESIMANSMTLLFGWWSMSGLFKTPAALFQNTLFLIGKKSNQENIARYIIQHYTTLKTQNQETTL